jgi:AcrR family transcriptional regulator
MASDVSPIASEQGLRERKKAETRQRISDIATLMFLKRGYDEVRVADIAAQAGVSEKTVYNYFPTKESLVLDKTDAQLAGTLAALARRPPGMSPTRAYVEELKRQLSDLFDADLEQVRTVIPRFGAMLDETPALRAAWGDHRHAMVNAVAEVLAADLGVDRREPEPMTTARALVSLTELSYDSVLRNAEHSASGAELLRRVELDLERGARLLETGTWSVALMIGGRRTAVQLREAATVTEQARRQVISALRQARQAWRENNHTFGSSDRPGA